jgi:hypothetical protein
VQVPAADVARYKGKQIAVGANIKCPSGGSWRVFTADDVSGFRYGDAVTATGYEWAEETFLVPSNATTLSFGFELSGVSGLDFYISQPVAGLGEYIGEDSPVFAPKPERLIPVVKFSPPSFFNANITFPVVADSAGFYSFNFDAYAETNGCFAPEVQLLDILLEGINFGAVITGTGGRFIATRGQLLDNIKYGPLIYQQVTQVKGATGGTLTLDESGYARVYGLSGDNWANVSIDINGVYV